MPCHTYRSSQSHLLDLKALRRPISRLGRIAFTSLAAMMMLCTDNTGQFHIYQVSTPTNIPKICILPILLLNACDYVIILIMNHHLLYQTMPGEACLLSILLAIPLTILLFTNQRESLHFFQNQRVFE